MIFLGSSVIQQQNNSDDKLYKMATKFDFYNDNIMSQNNVAASTFETKLPDLKPNKVNSDLVKYILKNFLSEPRYDETSKYYHKTLSYMTAKLGRLGYYVINQNFVFTQLDTKNTKIGVNVIGVLPGSRWGTSADRVGR